MKKLLLLFASLTLAALTTALVVPVLAQEPYQSPDGKVFCDKIR